MRERGLIWSAFFFSSKKLTTLANAFITTYLLVNLFIYLFSNKFFKICSYWTSCKGLACWPDLIMGFLFTGNSWTHMDSQFHSLLPQRTKFCLSSTFFIDLHDWVSKGLLCIISLFRTQMNLFSAHILEAQCIVKLLDLEKQASSIACPLAVDYELFFIL